MDYSKHEYPFTLKLSYLISCAKKKKESGTFFFQDCLINSLQWQFGWLTNSFVPPKQCLFTMRTISMFLEDIFLSSLQVSTLPKNIASDIFHTVLWLICL